MDIRCVAPVEKFRGYIFKPGATHGKDLVFKSLGYSAEASEALAKLYERQAQTKYENGDYVIGRQDEYGQRIDIEIEIVVIVLTEDGERVAETSYLRSGWMVQTEGGLRLNTPFSGFTRSRARRNL